MSKSNDLENAILDHALGTSAMAFDASVVVGLFSDDPGEAAGGTELTGFGYARQAVVFGSAVAGSASNSGAVTFTPSGGNWTQATHAYIFNSTGDRRYYGTLTTPRTGVDGEPLVFEIGSIVITED